MIRRPALIFALPFAVAAALLTGCGGQTPTTTPSPATTPVAAPSSAAPSSTAPGSPEPSSAAPSSPAPSASASASPSTSPSASKDYEVADPCKVISQSDMEDLVDADLEKGKSDTDKKLEKTCKYDANASGRTQVLTGIAFNFGSVTKQLKDLDLKGAEVKEIDVKGFDEAAWISSNPSGATAVGVVGQKGGQAYIAFVVGLKSKTTYRESGEDIITELAKG